MRTMVFTLALAVSVVAGCAPTFAPPMRTTHFGAPGRLEEGEGQIAGGVTGFGTGGPTVSVPVTDQLTVEAAYDVDMGTVTGWRIGSLGARWSSSPGRESFASWDAEGGVGAGVGGVKHVTISESESCWFSGGTCGSTERDVEVGDPDSRFAYGGYAGVGGALGNGTFAWMARARLQVSKASEIPTTVWFSMVTGPELRLGPFTLYVAVGVAVYGNRIESEAGGMYEGGLSLAIPVWAPKLVDDLP